MYWGRHLVRILQAVEVLARPGGASMDELAAGIDTDRRTAYRIKETLEGLNFPLYEDHSALDGRKRYRFEESYLRKLPNLHLPELKLCLSELVALYFLKGNSRLFSGTDIERNIDSAFAKLDAFMPEGVAKKLSTVKTLFVPAVKFAKDYRDKQELIDSLTEAMLRKQTCVVTYHSFSDDEIKRFRIDPLHFFERDGGLYLFVRASRFDEIRILALERVREIETTETTFSYPEDFDPDKFLNNAFGMNSDEPLEVAIRFSADQARYIKERQWAKEQRITDNEDGSIILHMMTSGWYDVKKWILSFGPDACLLEPEQLRQDLRKGLEQALAGY